jgi:hypothetical protein
MAGVLTINKTSRLTNSAKGAASAWRSSLAYTAPIAATAFRTIGAALSIRKVPLGQSIIGSQAAKFAKYRLTHEVNSFVDGKLLKSGVAHTV